MLSYAVCTYNRAERLPDVIRAMREQVCDMPYEILVINNNSSDDTDEVLARLADEPGAPLRACLEREQGIVPARNRAIQEALNNDILVFIDDDEIPLPGHLQAAVDCIVKDGADCVGGKIDVRFAPYERPAWLTDDVVGFLGRVDHGPDSLWVKGFETPVWSGNVAYRMAYFREHPELRFDVRYNRAGVGIGGGSDYVMFKRLLEAKARIRYHPAMAIEHLVDEWKLKRSYFLRLHYKSGLRRGRYELDDFPTRGLPAPPFLITQAMKQSLQAATSFLLHRAGYVRSCMSATHSIGLAVGYSKREK